MQISHATPAFITGAASGLGEATARRLAAAGAPVALFDRTEDAVAAVAKELDGMAFAGDVADYEAVEQAVEQVVNTIGTPRILVNCAGIAGTGGVLDRTASRRSMERFELVVRVNLLGTFNTIRTIGTHLAAAEPFGSGERGVIVNTASMAAFDGISGGVAYAASKGGVVGMTLPLARELGRYGIRTVTIAPGPFLTGLTSQFSAENLRALMEDVPFPNDAPGDPRWFADMVVAAVENLMLNGETIRLDGGDPNSLVS
jgi:NAD(P)-dependent dehydrogenase (short-subunit alcohol dehydrogenase family)